MENRIEGTLLGCEAHLGTDPAEGKDVARSKVARAHDRLSVAVRDGKFGSGSLALVRRYDVPKQIARDNRIFVPCCRFDELGFGRHSTEIPIRIASPVMNEDSAGFEFVDPGASGVDSDRRSGRKVDLEGTILFEFGDVRHGADDA